MSLTSNPSLDAVESFAMAFRGLGALPAALRLQVLTSSAMQERAAAAGVEFGVLAPLIASVSREARFDVLGLSSRDILSLKKMGLSEEDILTYSPEPGR